MASASGRDFVGRESETALLAGAVDGALRGHARFALIAGEPGIGKTTLASAAAAYGERSGALTLWGPCWEGEGVPAYWPWAQVIRTYARGRRTDDLLRDMGEGASDIARIAPEVGGRFLALTPEPEVDPEQARFRLFDHVGSFFRAASDEQPLILVLDDLHWADRSSLLLLRFMVQTLRDARVMVIGTYRDVEITPDHPFVDTVADLTVDRVALRGLGRAHVGELIATTTGAQPPDNLTEIVSGRTGGNPFFVKELVHLLAAQGRLDRPGPASPSAIPEGVRDVIRRRLARLPQACADLLGAASILGHEFTVDVLADLEGEPIAGVLPLLDQAASAGLIVEVLPARFSFAHALTHDVIYERLGPTRRSTLHWRAGVLLEQRHAYAAEVATHLVRGAASGDASKAAVVATTAARDALAMYAWDQAVALYEHALAVLPLTESEPALRLRTLLELGDARTAAGDLAGARETFDQAASLALAPGFAPELAHAALGFGGGLGGFEVPLFNERQIDLLGRALDELPSEDSAVRAWVLARLSVATSFVRPVEERASLSQQAADMARRIEADKALSYALSSLCEALSGPDNIDDRLEASSEMIRLAEQPSAGIARCGVPSCAVCLCNPEFALLGRRVRIVANLERGDIDAVDSDIEVYGRLAEHLRQPLYLWYVPHFRAMRAMMNGRLGDADLLLQESSHLATRLSSGNAGMLVAVQRAGLAFERGDLPTAKRVWLSMGHAWPDVLKRPSSATIGTLLQSIFGDPRNANPMLDHWLAEGGLETQVKDAEWLATAALFTDAAVRVGHVRSAEHVYHLMEPYSDRFIIDAVGARFMGSASHLLGRLAGLLRRHDDAERHLLDAITAHETVRAPVWAARSRHELARLLGEAGDSRVTWREELARQAEAAFRAFGLDTEAAAARAVTQGAPEEAHPGGNLFKHEGEYWTIAFAGVVSRLKDSKGLRDIDVLLRSPNREIAAIDLVAREGGAVARVVLSAEADEVLDDRARAAYTTRIRDLQGEIEQATDDNDPSRAEKARVELDALTEQLAGAYGLGRRARKAGDPAERARKAVTERIRDAIAKLAKEHPSLHRHLKASIKTGAFCSYAPERPVPWSF